MFAKKIIRFCLRIIVISTKANLRQKFVTNGAVLFINYLYMFVAIFFTNLILKQKKYIFESKLCFCLGKYINTILYSNSENIRTEKTCKTKV